VDECDERYPPKPWCRRVLLRRVSLSEAARKEGLSPLALL
jgi:hypothetical protein